jgi:hypothetical protein
MKKVLLLCSVVALSVMSSCKKDKLIDNEQNRDLPSLANKANGQSLDASKGNYRMKPEEIKERTDAQSKAFLEGYKESGNQNKMACVYVNSMSVFIIANTYDCGFPSTPTITYRCNIFEEGSLTNYSRNFEVFSFGFGEPATIVSESMTLLCPDWNPNGYSGECPRIISYDVTCPTVAYGYGGEPSIIFRAITACGSSHGNPPPPPFINDVEVNFWSCGSPAQCQASYTNNPPIVNVVSQNAGTFRVLTPCLTLCDVPYLVCPNSITLEYRKQGTTAWLAGSGFQSGLSQGVYEYRNVVFYYILGPNSPFTGNSLPSVGIGTVLVS